jgi:hypothetical protein
MWLSPALVPLSVFLLARPAVTSTVSPSRILPGNVLIADAGNDRIIEVAQESCIVWQFPNQAAPSPPAAVRYLDDAFFAPDGRRTIANQEVRRV